MGGFPVELPQKLREKKLRLQLNNFTQKLDFDVLGLEEGTKSRKKKRNKPHRGQKWVGWDERLSYDIQPYEIFFPVMTETAFYAKLAGRFSGSTVKPKSRDLLPLNLVQTCN